MKQSSAAKLFFPPVVVISWYLTAVISYGGLIASLPGYFAWYIQAPTRLGFTGLQMVLTVASGAASLLCALTCLGLASFLFQRKAGDRMALFISFYLLLYGVFTSGPLEMIEYLVFHQSGLISARVQTLLFITPTLVLMLSFPNGIIMPARFRWLILISIPISLVISSLPLNEINSIATLRSKLMYLLISTILFMGLSAQVYRYFWKSNPIERQQTKIVFLAYGCR